MKPILINIALFFAAICVLLIPISCNNDDSANVQGLVHLSFVDKTDSKARLESGSITGAVISLENADGASVFATEEITFYNFGGKMISEAILLPAGTFKLTEFHLIDELGSILYSSPVAGSELAYLVDTPLPITFTVSQSAVTTIHPEVLSTAGLNPEDFGYSSFSYTYVETTQFLVSALEFNSDPEILNWELTDANMVITNGTETLYEGQLQPMANEVIIRKGSESMYVITISKDGYTDITEEYSWADLQNYAETPLQFNLII